VFNTIGYLDERFHFFYQDNDYIMSLDRCGLLHGVYTGAHVSHKTGNTDRIAQQDCKYTPQNMHTQGETLKTKWYKTEPYMSGGYKPSKEYI
jgi:hypothetical protein